MADFQVPNRDIFAGALGKLVNETTTSIDTSNINPSVCLVVNQPTWGPSRRAPSYAGKRRFSPRNSLDSWSLVVSNNGFDTRVSRRIWMRSCHDQPQAAEIWSKQHWRSFYHMEIVTTPGLLNPGEPQNSWDLWMFIPIYPPQNMENHRSTRMIPEWRSHIIDVQGVRKAWIVFCDRKSPDQSRSSKSWHFFVDYQRLTMFSSQRFWHVLTILHSTVSCLPMLAGRIPRLRWISADKSSIFCWFNPWWCWPNPSCLRFYLHFWGSIYVFLVQSPAESVFSWCIGTCSWLDTESIKLGNHIPAGKP